MSISVCVFISAVFVIGPWIETKWFPAYSKFKIVSIERAGDRQSRVIFRFTKNRQCEPVGNSWFFGEPGAAFRQLKVQIDNQDAFTAVRPLGTQTSNPYVLDATVEELANATFAVIYNRCHPFWLTRSEIYP
jgi:hypothetical protein